MLELSVFQFGDRELRVIGDRDNPLFVLKDICDCLELGSPHKIAERLDDDEKERAKTPQNLPCIKLKWGCVMPKCC